MYDQSKAEGVLYSAANGQRRVTSSRSQEAVGGERRYGPTFYAAEHPIATELQTGAIYRAIELAGPPLENAEQASRLQTIALANHGALGPLLAERVSSIDPHDAVAEIEAIAQDFKHRYPSLRGDDPYTLALVQTGLAVIKEVTGVTLPIADVGEWLAHQTAAGRAEVVDKASAAFDALLGTLHGAFWDPHSDQLIHNGHHVAWRGPDGALDVNPHAPMVKEALKPFGGNRHLRVWAERGYILRDPDGKHIGVKRWNVQQRIWRIPAEYVTGKAVGKAKIVAIS